MRFSEQYKQHAIELYEENTMAEVFQKLAKRFPDKYHPNEKTIRRWRDDAKRQENHSTKPVEATIIPSSKYLITDDRIYEKVVDIPPWLKNISPK